MFRFIMDVVMKVKKDENDLEKDERKPLQVRCNFILISEASFLLEWEECNEM